MTGYDIFGVFFVLSIAIFSVGTFSAADKACRKSFQKLALANNELAINLLRRLNSESSENIFFSPFSISTAFGLLFHGTRGETAEELRKVLGYEKADLSNERASDSLSHYLAEVLKNDNSTDGYILNVANAILVDKSLDLYEEYKRDIQECFKASVLDVDFATESSNIMEEINAWVKEKTNGKIEKLLDQVNPATVAVLLNAVYFKGMWKTKFKSERTFNGTFYNKGIKERPVQMMHLESNFPYASVDDFQALELPYKGGNISMLILLPNQQNGLDDVEESLTPEKLDEIQHRLSSREVNVWLPKFKLQFEKELSAAMQDLGANQIFNADVANFSGMTSNRIVEVSQIVHKAIVEVNEGGSEAAAVTGITIVLKSGFESSNPKFRADHPFLFVIVEKGSNMILFLGRVKSL